MKGGIALLLFITLVRSSLVPTHVVLTLTGDPTTLQVTFTTSTKPTTPSVSFWPTATPSGLIETVAPPSDIHNFTHPTTGTIDYLTSITISKLPAYTTSYSYYVSGKSNDITTKSATFSFHTLPDANSTLKICIYGDLGSYGTALEETGEGGLIYWSKNHFFDFIIHNGDLAYNLASNSGATGIDFLTNIEAVSATIPYIVTAGNHEFMETSEAYYKNWFLGQTLLGQKSGSADPIMYYSFDIGTKLHIVVISTEVYCEDKSNLIPQYTWLAKDLAAVRARKEQPWILAFGHRQIYIATTSTLHSRLMRLGLQCTDSTLKTCDYDTPCKSGKDCGYSIEQLFAQYKVDMYFAGHEHTYNRMYPISPDLKFEAQDAGTYINPQHPVYVVSGAAGTDNTPPTEVLGSSLDSPTAASAGGYSFSLLQIFNSTHLRLQQNDVTTAKIVDSFWIVKDSSRPAWNKTATLTIDADTQLVCDQ
jgi:hypothetical protein